MSRERAIQIVPTATDEAFATWLGARFSDPEYAMRIQIVQVGAGNRHGEVIYTHDERAPVGDKKKDKPRLSRERIVELSNAMITSSQLDCDALGRSTTYAALAFHAAMGADSYSRFMFRLRPKNIYANAEGVVDVEEGSRIERLLLGLLESERRDKRWTLEMAMNAISGAMERDAQRIEKTEMMLDGRLEKETKLIEATEAALSKAEDRRLKRAWHDLTVGTVGEMVSSVKSQILPAIKFKLMSGAGTPPHATSNGTAPHPSGTAGSPPSAETPATGTAPEVVILGRFLAECEANGEVAENLFGKDVDGKPVSTGIFNRQQAALLVIVHSGGLPVSLLDQLLPGAGELAVTDEQRAQAMAIMTPAMSSTLIELFTLRMAARASK